MTLELKQIDTITIRVSDVERSLDFYTDKLGLELVDRIDGPPTLKLDNGYLQLIKAPADKDLRAHNFTIGSADVTLQSDLSINEIVAILGSNNILLLKGPSDILIDQRQAQSVYFRDPDKNLIEIRTYNIVELNQGDKHPEKHTFTQSSTSPGITN